MSELLAGAVPLRGAELPQAMRSCGASTHGHQAAPYGGPLSAARMHHLVQHFINQSKRSRASAGGLLSGCASPARGTSGTAQRPSHAAAAPPAAAAPQLRAGGRLCVGGGWVWGWVGTKGQVAAGHRGCLSLVASVMQAGGMRTRLPAWLAVEGWRNASPPSQPGSGFAAPKPPCSESIPLSLSPDPGRKQQLDPKNCSAQEGCTLHPPSQQLASHAGRNRLTGTPPRTRLGRAACPPECASSSCCRVASSRGRLDTSQYDSARGSPWKEGAYRLGGCKRPAGLEKENRRWSRTCKRERAFVLKGCAGVSQCLYIQPLERYTTSARWLESAHPGLLAKKLH